MSRLGSVRSPSRWVVVVVDELASHPGLGDRWGAFGVEGTVEHDQIGREAGGELASFVRLVAGPCGADRPGLEPRVVGEPFAG